MIVDVDIFLELERISVSWFICMVSYISKCLSYL